MAVESLTEQVVENVADHFEEAAEVTRQINQHVVGYFLGGVGLGVMVGFFMGYRFNKQKTRADALKEAEKEIEEVREVYRQKTVALENNKAKTDVDEILESANYSTQTDREGPPSHVPVPVRPERPLPAPVPIFEVPQVEEKSKNDDWDYKTEIRQRAINPRLPYIIHQDEFAQTLEGYAKVAYTYYALDGVLTDEGGNKLESLQNIVGAENLEKFGHGSDDYDVVYIRNNSLNLEIEVCRINDQSYEEHVLGLSRDDIEHS